MVNQTRRRRVARRFCNQTSRELSLAVESPSVATSVIPPVPPIVPPQAAGGADDELAAWLLYVEMRLAQLDSGNSL